MILLNWGCPNWGGRKPCCGGLGRSYGTSRRTMAHVPAPRDCTQRQGEPNQGGCILLILPSSFDFSDINSNYSPSSSNAPRLHALVSDSLKCLILMTKPASPALLGMHRAPCEYYRAIYSCSVHARSHRAHLNVVTSIYTSSLLVHRHRPDAHTHERPINPNLGRRPLPLPKPQPLTSPYCRRSAREVGTQGF